jgi:hypothetical protein
MAMGSQVLDEHERKAYEQLREEGDKPEPEREKHRPKRRPFKEMTSAEYDQYMRSKGM